MRNDPTQASGFPDDRNVELTASTAGRTWERLGHAVWRRVSGSYVLRWTLRSTVWEGEWIFSEFARRRNDERERERGDDGCSVVRWWRRAFWSMGRTFLKFSYAQKASQERVGGGRINWDGVQRIPWSWPMGMGRVIGGAFYLLPNVNLHPVVLEIFRLIPVLPVTSVMHPVACLRCGSMYRGKLEALSSLCSSKIIMGPWNMTD